MMTTDRYGKTTYRDLRGRIQGLQTTDLHGKTIWHNTQGRIQNSKTVR